MLNINMTSIDKQKIAGFLDLAGNFLNSGYHLKQTEYNFDETEAPASQSQNSDNSLEKIAAEIKICKNCRLGDTRKNAVPGEGVDQPLVMVIGEGPGADEDTQGRPFVGKAGQLLDKMLSSINLSRNSNCFIANVVKCRPPQNRDPYPDEREACSHFLNRQISILKPKFILLVGNIASQTVLKATEPVGKMRGKFREYNVDGLSIPLLVTYHPSALLHNDTYKRPAWEDLKLLRSKIDECGGI
jgi:DNA polymerase